jgi:uncharacterized protein YgiM (DUF1202 family)
VDYNGYTGYVKTEYLTTEDPSTATTDTSSSDTSNGTEDTSSSAIAAGTVISLPNTCNIRSGMSETADRVGTAYQGDKVTVVMSYSEGWTKVTWNNKTGYIKTSLLQ